MNEKTRFLLALFGLIGSIFLVMFGGLGLYKQNINSMLLVGVGMGLLTYSVLEIKGTVGEQKRRRRHKRLHAKLRATRTASAPTVLTHPL